MFQADGRTRLSGIFCPEWAVQITQTKAELLVLSQLVYWFGMSKKGDLRAKIEVDGYWWVAKTYRKLAKETHLTPGQVRGAVRSLRASGVLITAAGVGNGEIPRYRLSPAGIQKLVEQALMSTPSVAEGDDDE